MSATKRFYEGCAAAGMCPVHSGTLDVLDRLELDDNSTDLICYCEYDYHGIDRKLYSQGCITMESAKRLISLGLATDEIECFVECWGEVAA